MDGLWLTHGFLSDENSTSSISETPHPRFFARVREDEERVRQLPKTG